MQHCEVASATVIVVASLATFVACATSDVGSSNHGQGFQWFSEC